MSNFLSCGFSNAHDSIPQGLDGHVPPKSTQLVHGAQFVEKAAHVLQEELVVGGNNHIQYIPWTAEWL